MKRLCALLLALTMLLGLTGCTGAERPDTPANPIATPRVSMGTVAAPEYTAVPDATGNAADAAGKTLDENGSYTSKDDVAEYLNTYGELPDNFITKREAEQLGWTGGSLEPYASGMCIGGSYFGNYEGLLPEADGRTWTECDIDTMGANGRGSKRIVYSNDGLIYYTEDHYKSFELLYGEP